MRSVYHLPQTPGVYACTVASVTVSGGDLKGTWTFTGPWGAGFATWFWMAVNPGGFRRSRVVSAESGAAYSFDGPVQSGDTGQAFFEARNPSGELLARSAVLDWVAP